MATDTWDILIDDLTKLKAELISYGRIYIPKHIQKYMSIERPKSGPHSGEKVIGLEFSGKRVKLRISDNPERFVLEEDEKGLIIKEHNMIRARAKSLDLRYHAPGQLFISIENRCIYSCLFCTAGNISIPEERLLDFVRKAMDSGNIKSVAITSGVYPSIEDHINKIERFVRIIKTSYPDVPLGVEPVVKSDEHISRLYSAGADEIKINVQTANRELFDRICGYMDYDKIFDFLQSAVDIFGRGKVMSNVIYGIGESDEDVVKTMERIADIGAVPNPRAIRVNPEIKKRFERKGCRVGETNPDRIIRIAQILKKILQERNLSTKNLKTMCFPCGCCDVIPFQDI